MLNRVGCLSFPGLLTSYHINTEVRCHRGSIWAKVESIALELVPHAAATKRLRREVSCFDPFIVLFMMLHPFPLPSFMFTLSI